MTVLKAHFDGKVLVPEGPVNLPVNCTLEIHVQTSVASNPVPREQQGDGKTFLQKLAERLAEHPSDPNAPTDGAAQHDHYLYGTPKR